MCFPNLQPNIPFFPANYRYARIFQIKKKLHLKFKPGNCVGVQLLIRNSITHKIQTIKYIQFSLQNAYSFIKLNECTSKSYFFCLFLDADPWWTVSLAMIGKFQIAASFAVIYVYAGELMPTVVRSQVKLSRCIPINPLNSHQSIYRLFDQ